MKTLSQICEILNNQSEWNPNNEQMFVENGFTTLCHIDNLCCSDDEDCIAIGDDGKYYIIPTPDYAAAL